MTEEEGKTGRSLGNYSRKLNGRKKEKKGRKKEVETKPEDHGGIETTEKKQKKE